MQVLDVSDPSDMIRGDVQVSVVPAGWSLILPQFSPEASSAGHRHDPGPSAASPVF